MCLIRALAREGHPLLFAHTSEYKRLLLGQLRYTSEFKAFIGIRLRNNDLQMRRGGRGVLFGVCQKRGKLPAVLPRWHGDERSTLGGISSQWRGDLLVWMLDCLFGVCAVWQIRRQRPRRFFGEAGRASLVLFHPKRKPRALDGHPSTPVLRPLDFTECSNAATLGARLKGSVHPSNKASCKINVHRFGSLRELCTCIHFTGVLAQELSYFIRCRPAGDEFLSRLRVWKAHGCFAEAGAGAVLRHGSNCS